MAPPAGASKTLTVREAIEAALLELGGTIGGTVVDMVRQAREQLHQPPTGSMKDQVAVACAQMDIEMGWHVEVAQGPRGTHGRENLVYRSWSL